MAVRKSRLATPAQAPLTASTPNLVANSRLETPRKLLRILELLLKELPLLTEKKVPVVVLGVVVKGGVAEFVEPDLAKPEPIYTGLPLEEGPNTRIKRELLWRKRRPTPEPEEDLEQKKQIYDATLEVTPEAEASDERQPLKLKILMRAQGTPKQSGKRGGLESPNSTASRHSKRIKVSSPKKLHISNLAGVTLGVKVKGAVDLTKDNDDFCSSCGLPGIFICCESCPKSFHFTCCDPPLAEVPEDDWHCRECIIHEHPEALGNYHLVGVFGPLLLVLDLRNPTVFALPKSIRDDTFIGVHTGDCGDYEDDGIKPELTTTKLNGNQIKGFNRDELLEVDRLYDINGKPYLCHKCGELGLHHRTLAHCDYCPLIWHLDCLPTVLCSPKQMGLKWRCPNHVEDMLPRNYANFRMLRNAKVTDVALYNHFLRMGNLLLAMLFQHADSPYIKQGYVPNLNDYLEEEHEQRQEDESKLGSKVDAKYQPPEWMLNQFAQNNQVMAPIRHKSALGKLIQDTRGVIYRIPELTVTLDFITKVKKEKVVHRQRHGTRIEEIPVENVKQQVMSTIADYETKKQKEGRLEELENDPAAMDTYDSLASLKAMPWLKKTLDDFVAVALENGDKVSATPVVTTDEVDDLIKIKRLLQLKGKDKVMEFLRT